MTLRHAIRALALAVVLVVAVYGVLIVRDALRLGGELQQRQRTELTVGAER